MRKFVVVLAAVTALSAACSGSKASGSSDDAYTIGVLTSQTGSASQLGVGELRGAQLAADSLNAAGGVAGHRIQLTVLDDQSQPDQAVTLTRRLAKDKVAAIVGPSVVADCKAVGPLVSRGGPVDYCLSPGIDPGGYQFSASVGTPDLAQAGLTYWKKQGITRIGLISTTDGSGTQGAAAVKSAAAKVGVRVVAEATYAPTAVSATSELQKATQNDPQALVMWATGTSTGVVLKAVQQQGLRLPVLTTNGNLANAFLQRIAAYTPKTLLIPATRDIWWQNLPATDPAAAQEKRYHDAYRQKYGEEPDYGPGVGYDAILVVAEAMKTAGDDPGKLRTALEGLTGFSGVVGTYSFSAQDHRGVALDTVAMVQATGGTFQFVGK